MVLPHNSIFISYRKDDSAGWSAKLADHLRKILGDGAVFIDDSTGIPFGTQWPDQIAVALDQCRIFLPVIAPSWHQTTNLDRLKEPDDWVRRELITIHGRRGSVLCVPVFVNEAPEINSKHFSDDPELQKVVADLMIDQGIKLDRGTEFWPAKIDSLVSRIETHLGITIPSKFKSTEIDEVEVKGQPNNLPLTTLGTLFKGREPFLDALHKQLNQSDQNAAAITNKRDVQRPSAVHGTGGIGKTRVAIEFAWRYASDYTALLFLSAETPLALDTNLARLTDVLQIEQMAQASDEQRIQATINWLQANPGWLVILDNVDTDEAVVAVKKRLAQLTQGHVLITSRVSQWSKAVETLDLDLLTIEDATSYLLEATEEKRKANNNDTESAQQIAIKVGRLALGLEHAAAWINTQYVGFSDYLEQWERDEAGILTEFDRSVIDYPHELLVAWKLSVDRLDNDAREALETLSWFSPEPIPDHFLTAEPEDARSNLHKAIRVLAKYSLASRVQQDNQFGFQIHRLVQATTRFHQRHSDTGKSLPSLEHALTCINEAFKGDPRDVRTWPTMEPLVDHVVHVCHYGVEAEKTTDKHPTSRLLNDAGQFYDAKARYAEAEPLMRRALQIDEHSFGEDHPNVAIRLNNLASLLQATNRFSEAEPLMRRALTIDEHSFGEDHARAGIDLNNLAQLLQVTNRLSEAEPLMRRALQIDKQSFGEDHPRVATDLNNLAQLLQVTNRLSDAEPLLRRALEIDEHSLGENHSDVARDLNNLAQLLKATNRVSEAEPLMRRALQINEHSFGEDHPNVAGSLNNLARLLQATNRLSEVEPLMRRALQIDESSFGKDHPRVAVQLNNLALLLQDTNCLSDAEPLMHRALQINEHSFGEDHPDVARNLNNLATLLKETNRVSEAEPLMRRALQIDEQSFGEDHPDVAIDLNNLADLLRVTNRVSEAEPLMRRAVEIFHQFGKTTGHKHPHMEDVITNYSSLLKQSGLAEENVKQRVRSILQ